MDHALKMTGSRAKGNQEKPLLPVAAWIFFLCPLWVGAAEVENGGARESRDPATSQEPGESIEHPALARTEWSIAFEPALMNPKNALPLAGSQDVVIVPAELRDWIWQEMHPERFLSLQTPLETYLRQATRNTLPLLEAVEPQYYRNPKQVIEYGLLQSEDDPRLPTVILLPEFYERFEPVFGPDFLVILPNRLSVYMFPRLAGNLQEHAAMLLGVYETSQYPATSLSKDVFMITENGVVLGGRLLDPRTDPVELFTRENPSIFKPQQAEPTEEPQAPSPRAALELPLPEKAEEASADAGSSDDADPAGEPRDEDLPALRAGGYE
jgi:hypothetical protein